MSWRSLADGVIDAAKSTFGQEVIYTPSDGDPVTITGIFNDIFEVVEQGTAQIMSSKPSLGIKKSDLEVEPRMDDNVQIGAKTYKVSEIQRDGESSINLFLNEVI